MSQAKKVVVEDIFWKFDFGKHFGKTVGEVFDTDPTYLMWAHRDTERFTLSEDMYDQLRGVVGGGPNPKASKIKPGPIPPAAPPFDPLDDGEGFPLIII